MNVKTYRGKSAEECFQKVKRELGLDAVILQSGSIQSPFGKLGSARYEVVAALDITIPADKSPTGVEVRRPLTFSTGRIEPPTPASPQHEPSSSDDDRYFRLEKQLSALTASMSALTTSSKPPVGRTKTLGASEPEPYQSLYRQLLDSGIAEPLARRMLAEIPGGLSDASASLEARSLIADLLKTTPRFDIVPGKTQLVAFLGGTGVGKTTTIAKIAAKLALKENRSVGIISMDTHRVAAAKQLLTYGEILRVPVKVAYNKQELKQALAEYVEEKRDVVLLDTAGRSPNDAMPISETACALEGMGSVYTYLTVPATISYRNFENTVEKFQSHVHPDAIILTKMDEACDGACFGHLLNIQAKTGIPLAFIANGQRVPDDIMLADANAIAARMLSYTPL